MHAFDTAMNQLASATHSGRREVRTFGQHASAPPGGKASAPTGLQGLVHMVWLIEACSGPRKS